VENNVEKRTVDFKPTVVTNETQLPEPVHEEICSPASCTHHLCQSFLTDLGDRNFRFSVLAEMG